jgi:hypothetical protein
MPAGSDNVFPKVILSEGAAPATPSANQVKIYAKADGLMYSKDDAGAETLMSGGAGGAPTTADYLVGTANGSLSAEIVVGATPGGELGNTWASPTVDDTHAGGHHQSELDYVQITSAVSLTATTEGTAHTCITGTSQAYEAVPTLIEVSSPHIGTPADAAGRAVIVLLYDGATLLGRIGTFITPVAAETRFAFRGAYRLTPTAATHQYIIKAYVTGGTGSFAAGAGGSGTNLPAFLRITRV